MYPAQNCWMGVLALTGPESRLMIRSIKGFETAKCVGKYAFFENLKDIGYGQSASEGPKAD